MSKTIRPSILPDNKKLVIYPLVVCLVVSVVGIVINNPVVVILPLIVLVVFPGLPIFFHLLIHIFVKVELQVDKIIIKDYLGNNVVRAGCHQEMAYGDITYIYYLGKEINLLKSLRKKLKKFNLSLNENDYTRENLTGKYNVPAEVIENFEKSSKNVLNDYTATAVLMKLDDIYGKYNVSKKVAKDISREMEKDENFSYEYVSDRLKEYPVEPEDLDGLKDEFSNIKADIIQSFLLTKVNLAKYKKVSGYRGGMAVTAKVDNALVLANKDGTKKVYLMHFHDLSREGWQAVMKEIKNHSPNIAYLMTKSEYKNLGHL